MYQESKNKLRSELEAVLHEEGLEFNERHHFLLDDYISNCINFWHHERHFPETERKKVFKQTAELFEASCQKLHYLLTAGGGFHADLFHSDSHLEPLKIEHLQALQEDLLKVRSALAQRAESFNPKPGRPADDGAINTVIVLGNAFWKDCELEKTFVKPRDCYYGGKFVDFIRITLAYLTGTHHSSFQAELGQRIRECLKEVEV